MQDHIAKTELVREGTFNGYKITKKDLENWVKDFEENLKDGYMPTVHIGHTDEMDDTKEAEGFITRMWVEGDRVFASIRGIAEDFIEKAKKYPYRSIEATKERLRSLALLGATPPAVKNEPVLLSESKNDTIFIINKVDMKDDVKDNVQLEEETPIQEEVEIVEETVEEVETTEVEEIETTEESTDESVEEESTESEEVETEEVQLSEDEEKTVKLSESEYIKMSEKLKLYEEKEVEREIEENVEKFIFSEKTKSGVFVNGDPVKNFAKELSKEQREKFFAMLSELKVVDSSVVSGKKGFDDDAITSEDQKERMYFSELQRIKEEKGVNTDKAIAILKSERPDLVN